MKKISIILVFCLLATLFAGCGSNDQTNNDNANNNNNDGNKQEQGMDYFKSENYEGVHLFDVKKTSDKIVSGGTTEYRIVMPKDATETEKTAVNELQYFFEEATGLVLTVQTDDIAVYDANAKYLSVGENAYSKSAGVTADYDILGEAGLRIVTVGKSVFMLGAKERGTLYAVYEFLSQCFEYEFFSDNVIRLRRNVTDLPLMSFDITDVPDYEYIMSNYGFIRYNATVRNRFRMVNDDALIIPVDGTINHNSFKWLPKSQYEKSHPKWYSDDGKQLCYTAHGVETEFEEMVGTVTKKMKTILQDPDNADKRMITFTHEDTQTWCACKTCTELKNKYGGANSASVILFLNRVKENIDKWFEGEGSAYKRDLLILFLGYHQTNKPPSVYDAEKEAYVPIDDSVKCREGVGVYFAETNGDYTQSFYERGNSDIAANFSGWGCVSDDIFFWSYQTNFSYYLTPYNSFNSMQDIYKYGKLNHAFLLFDQGQYNEEGKPTAWGMLKVYLTSKLAWNVNADYDALIQDFFDVYFGPASDDMMQMFTSFRLRADYNQQYNGYTGSRSVFTNALQEAFWPKSLLGNWLQCCENALASIEPLKETDSVMYEAYRFNICLERLSPLYLIVELYDTAFDDAVIREYKQLFSVGAGEAGITKEGEKTTIDSLYNRWGV